MTVYRVFVQPIVGREGSWLTASALLVQASLLAAIELDLPLIRPILGFIAIALLPGALTLGLLQFDFNRIEGIPYTIVLSCSEMMALGAAGSIFSRGAPFSGPFTNIGFLIWTVLPIFLLTLIFQVSNRQPTRPSFPVERIHAWRLVVLSMTSLLLIIAGTHILNSHDQNGILIAGILLVSLIPLLSILATPTELDYALLSWAIGGALLLQNTLININLQAGDGRFEYGFAMVSLLQGAYDPTIPTIRATSLRLSVLNPEFVMATGLPLETVMTVIHPMLLSVLCIALFQLFKQQFSVRTAFLGVILVTFSVPWLNTLSRNSRTGIAILFAIVCVTVLLDEETDRTLKSLLVLACFFGIPASHYGIAPFFGVLLGVAIVLEILGQYLGEENSSFGVTPLRVLIFALALSAWFIYTAQGTGFRFIVLSMAKMVESLTSGGVSGSQAAKGASTALPSLTYQILKYEYLLVLLLAAVGLSLSFFNRLQSLPAVSIPEKLGRLGHHFKPTSSVYTSIAAGAAAVVPLAFMPRAGIGIPRIFIFVCMFLAPFTILTVKHILAKLSLPSESTLAITFALLLTINSGVFAATITHDNSPQPYLDRPSIIESGDNELIYGLFRVYRTDEGWASSDWLYEYGNLRIYGAGVQPNIRTDEMRSLSPLERRPDLMNESSNMCDGYIRLTPANYIMDEVVLTYYPDFIDYGNQSLPLEELPVDDRNLVYDAGQTTVYGSC